MRVERVTKQLGACALMVLAMLACADPKVVQNRETGPHVPVLEWRQTPEPVESAPISLTASDGSGLVLVSLKARAVIEEPLAFTELHLTFHNPESRRREGRFAITLPPEAAISRFAMRVGGEWQEGEVVERRRAQAVYEDFLHRRQDPALLERDGGNQFTARVFPIEANEDKELIVAYSEELPRTSEPYRLLLKGLPELAALEVDIHFGSNSATGLESSVRARGATGKLTLRERHHTPTADLAVELPKTGVPVALRSGELVVARVSPLPKAEPDEISGLTVLFDTSASRALGFEAQVERLDALLSELGRRGGSPDFDLRIVAFDQSVEDIYEGPARGFSMRDKSRLLSREALGASNLEAALAHLARLPKRHERVLVVSDGVITAGPDDTTSLREAVTKLAAHGVRRLDVLAEGGIRDEDVLTALTRAGLRNAGVVLDSRLSLNTLADKLLLSAHERIDVRVPGATWQYPRALEAVQAGDEYLVFAELAPERNLKIELDKLGTHSPEAREAPRPLVERAWARAKIAALSTDLRSLRGEGDGSRAALERQIVALSTRHRVLSELTALLVLESPSEYARFGLDTRALANILRVGDDGLELFQRGELNVAIEAPLASAKGVAVDEESGEKRREMAPADDKVPLSRDRPAERDADPLSPASRGASRGGAKAAIADIALAEPEARARKERSVPMPAAAPSALTQAPAPPAKATDSARIVAREQGQAEAEALLRQPKPEARSGSAGGGMGSAAARGIGSLGEVVPAGALVASPAQVTRADVRLHQAFGVDSALAARVLRGGLSAQARNCYPGFAASSGRTERLGLEFVLSDKGAVSSVFAVSGRLSDTRAQNCLLSAAGRLRFPKPESGRASIHAGVEFSSAPATPRPEAVASARPAARKPPPKPKAPRIDDAYEGALAQTLEALQRGDVQGARSLAEAAHAQNPGDVMALIALGEALEVQGDHARAARAYGSLIDLFPSRTDLRRMAGARLERLPAEHGLDLAADTYQRALAQRPDHPSAHRLYAYALVKQGKHAEAFAVLERAIVQGFRADRFEGAERILREDAQLVLSAWLRAQPEASERIQAALSGLGLAFEREPSLRFVLNWETDANDVDFHIYDGRGGHAYYMQPKLGSGGRLYADITSGYGPECFAIQGKARAYPYVLQAHYFARGPMGYGMGKLQIIEHDGRGGLRFSEHPFAIMKDKAFVQLAEYQPK